ncbi:MAG: hypothetical protein IKH06_00635 [Clostridiales bacterium]|nr:hypothetical protein [Clostridiales bacterium]
MKRSNLKLKIVTAAVFASLFTLSGCLPFPTGGGSGNGGMDIERRSLSDSYKSAEDYCNYWYGPCTEIDSYENSYGKIVHEMKDEELGFKYTVEESDGGYYFYHDFEYYYINEFLKRTDFKDLISEFNLKIEQEDMDRLRVSPRIKISTDRELTDEESRRILSDVMGKLSQFDSERNVFNKPGDNKSVGLSVWSAPWEKEKANNAYYHVVNDTFGDN